MRYEIACDSLMFPLDRTKIIDISPGDTLEVKELNGASYTWTEQDREFMENNPDDELFLQVEKNGKGFRATKIVLR